MNRYDALHFMRNLRGATLAQDCAHFWITTDEPDDFLQLAQKQNCFHVDTASLNGTKLVQAIVAKPPFQPICIHETNGLLHRRSSTKNLIRALSDTCDTGNKISHRDGDYVSHAVLIVISPKPPPKFWKERFTVATV